MEHRKRFHRHAYGSFFFLFLFTNSLSIKRKIECIIYIFWWKTRILKKNVLDFIQLGFNFPFFCCYFFKSISTAFKQFLFANFANTPRA